MNGSTGIEHALTNRDAMVRDAVAAYWQSCLTLGA